ncbi:uncharacterized protein LOC128547315 [Mercenaria mercenaria]|uniref:uncharacterized protein LOC128547315 n=1 Tax=Mercenaria mercenaria TaxID=6596 RepID=UPI00234F6681|nr:uncharacterized protein LOC128547315 [Mercenaria mercenaria]
MSSDEYEYETTTTTTHTSSSNRRYQSGETRTRFVVIGVATAVFLIVIVLVVVAVVVQQKKKANENKETKDECGPYNLPDGFNFSMLSPTVISRSFNCPLKGDCWTGEQCYQCLKLETWKVGNINYIPVCCENCLVRGLYVSNSECRCRK